MQNVTRTPIYFLLNIHHNILVKVTNINTHNELITTAAITAGINLKLSAIEGFHISAAMYRYGHCITCPSRSMYSGHDNLPFSIYAMQNDISIDIIIVTILNTKSSLSCLSHSLKRLFILTIHIFLDISSCIAPHILIIIIGKKPIISILYTPHTNIPS